MGQKGTESNEMKETNKLEFLLKEVTELEDKYYAFNREALDRGDRVAYELTNMQANTFQEEN